MDNNILRLNYYQVRVNDNIIKWIKYIPNNWNIERLLNKQKQDLTSKDLLILHQYSSDNHKLSLIRELLHYQKEHKEGIKITTKELDRRNKFASDVSDIVLNFSLDNYANIKLSHKDLTYIKERVKELSDASIFDIECYIENITEDSLNSDYLSYLLRKLLIEKRKDYLKNKTKKRKLKPITRKPYYKYK